LNYRAELSGDGGAGPRRLGGVPTGTTELKRRNAIGKQTWDSIMPTYRFHVSPEDSSTDVLLRCTHDDDALNEAKRTLRDLLLDSAQQGKTTSKTVEVIREDGTIVGIVVADDDG
jgi:hypothetical protein